MKKALLTPFVIFALLLLPSCSSEQKRLCKEAEIARDTLDKEAGALQQQAKVMLTTTYEFIGKKWELEAKAEATYKKSLQVIINNQQCFSPIQDVEAQDYLNRNK